MSEAARGASLYAQSTYSDIVGAAIGDRAAARLPAIAAVRRLTLTDFRCYDQLRLDLDVRPVVLIGDNGAGKTNILEALSYLVPGRGLRRARLSEAIRRDADAPSSIPAPARRWAVAAQIDGLDGPVDLGTGLNPDTEKRVVHIDGAPAANQAALGAHLSVQWLTPAMDRLFAEGSAGRRRFLDRMVFGRDPAHAGRITAYEHAMRERARLLERGDQAAGDWLGALESTMAEKGVAIAAARLDMAGRLAAQLDEADEAAFPAADLAVEGEVEAWLASGTALAAEDNLRRALSGGRGQDAASGRTARGPHRSDLCVRHRGKARPAADCSTGEQKALLISLILAQARLQVAERGRPPILLLDEVAAHLDGARRAALFEAILGLNLQAWMTGTEAALFRPLGDRVQAFHIADARASATELDTDKEA